MNTLRNLIFFAIALFLTSCVATVKFPISDATPAAEIMAKMKQDKNKNYVIEVTAIHMASADRLNPPKKCYVAWIVSENNGILNIGQLNNKNAEKLYLKTITPFIVNEIFITAEEQGDISYPYGTEISRTSFPIK
ncbi:MAG: hypothetical protein PHS59_02995 [Paludibacter sp.]|nr:hypothetical protein [Paludibacter sp.]